MTTAYTSLLGFALPVTGELSGTWGDTVNNSITELVEDAIAATATQTVALGDWDLTTTGSGAANQARCAIIIPTGSPGVTRNINAPKQSKAYVVVNQSNAAVVFRGGPSTPTTGVTVAAGDKVMVAWSGTDFVQIGSTVTPGGSNTQVQYNNSGTLAGSANLVILSGGLPRFTAYRETVVSATVSTSTYNIDLSLSNIFNLTLANNVTFTFTNPPSAGTSALATIILTQDATGNRTATFTSAKYTDGTAPVLSTGANDIDVLTFFTVDGGTSYFGTFAMANVS
jgi:hypothetical protein